VKELSLMKVLLSDAASFVLVNRLDSKKCENYGSNGHMLTGEFGIDVGVERNTLYFVRAKEKEKGEIIHCAVLNAQDVHHAAIKFNARTTVATVFCFCQLIEMNPDVEFKGDQEAWQVAKTMSNAIIGANNEGVLDLPPNGRQTISNRVFKILCSLWNNCVGPSEFHTHKRKQFVRLMGSSSLLGALYTLARNPFQDYDTTKELFELAGIEHPKNCQDWQWNLAVKANRSGSLNFMISGPGIGVIDKYERVWITNNFRPGLSESASYIIVLEPDGRPAYFSPVQGGGLLGTAFGICTNLARDVVYVGNFGWGIQASVPTMGSISLFSVGSSPNEGGGVPLHNTGFNAGLSRVQGMAVDSKDNLWICSYGTHESIVPFQDEGPYTSDNGKNSAIVCYFYDETLGYATEKGWKSYEFVTPSKFNCPFHLCMKKSSTGEEFCYVSVAGMACKDKTRSQPSAVYKLRLSGGEIINVCYWVCMFREDSLHDREQPVYSLSLRGQPIEGKVPFFAAFRQITYWKQDDPYIYVGCLGAQKGKALEEQHKSGNPLPKNLSCVWKINTEDETTAEIFPEYNNEAVFGPWGLSMDCNGKLFVANFLQADVTTTNGVGNSQYHDPAGYNPGIGVISNFFNKPYSSQVLRLPTGGESVKLANGDDLYGSDDPCFNPLMRLTSTTIDRAGNVWALNNWKPSKGADCECADFIKTKPQRPTECNPGGDGVVIFIGQAAAYCNTSNT